MLVPTILLILPFLLHLPPTALAQETSDVYTGYSLEFTGDDPASATYATANTASNTTYPVPDVYLNASVHVGTIDILVRELSAKVNIDAKVLSLLDFGAGVDVSVDQVRLTIQNVSAKVELTARLGNLVKMVGSVLDSLDLNPILAELGGVVGGVVGGVGEVVDGVVGDVVVGGGGGGGGAAAGTQGGGGGENASTEAVAAGLNERSLFPTSQLDQGILYSINDYGGNAHTNRVLTQEGLVVDQSLDNGGIVYNQRTVGRFDHEMEFTGRERDGVVMSDGSVAAVEREYVYRPFVGIEVVARVYLGDDGEEVLGTRLVSELEGGGSSSVVGVEEV